MYKNEYQNTYKVLERFASEFIEQYKIYLEMNDIADGELYRSIKVDSIKIYSDEFIITIELADYWKYIEYGRRKGAKFPPIDVIRTWIKKRNIVPRPMKLKSGKTIVPRQESLAFLIARSISQKGIQARPFFKTAADRMLEKFKSEIEDAIVLDIEETMNNEIDDII